MYVKFHLLLLYSLPSTYYHYHYHYHYRYPSMSNQPIADEALPREFYPATPEAILAVGRRANVVRYQFSQFKRQMKSDEVLVMLMDNLMQKKAVVVPNEDYYHVHKESIDRGYVVSCEYFFVPRTMVMAKVTLTDITVEGSGTKVMHLETDA